MTLPRSPHRPDRRPRRALGLVAALTAAPLVLTACGNQAGGGSSGDEPSVALVLALTANPFMQEVTTGATDAAEDLGARLTVAGPAAPNPTEGVSALNRVVAQGVDGVTVMPLPASLWNKGLTDAAAATSVNTVNNLPVQGGRGARTFIGINDAAAATEMMDHLAAQLPPDPKGAVVLGNCIPGAASLDTRINTYTSYVEEKLPGVTVVGPLTTTTDPNKNLSTWTQAYNANPDALAFIGSCDSDGPSLARLHADNPGDYLTATFDINPSTLTGIRDGDLTVALDETPYLRGYLATALLVREAQGKEPVTGFVDTRGVLVTRENVEETIEPVREVGQGQLGWRWP